MKIGYSTQTHIPPALSNKQPAACNDEQEQQEQHRSNWGPSVFMVPWTFGQKEFWFASLILFDFPDCGRITTEGKKQYHEISHSPYCVLYIKLEML